MNVFTTVFLAINVACATVLFKDADGETLPSVEVRTSSGKTLYSGFDGSVQLQAGDTIVSASYVSYETAKLCVFSDASVVMKRR